MDSTGSINSIQTSLDKLATQRDELGDLWATRKLRLDLCLQLRIFERDALEVHQLRLKCDLGYLIFYKYYYYINPSGSLMLCYFIKLSAQYEMWEGQLQNGDIPRDLKETETQLRNLNEHITHIQTATFEVTQRGKELLQVCDFFVVYVMTHLMINPIPFIFISEEY